MCTLSTASEKVNVIGYFDLAITVLTIIAVGYGVILPYSPYKDDISLETRSSNSSALEGIKPFEPFPFWLSVLLFGTIGLIGILWSLVLVKSSGLEVN